MLAFRRTLLALVIGLLVFADHVVGDLMVATRAMKASTIAEIFVEEGTVRVELEIGAADLLAFRNLMPDELYAKLEAPSDESRSHAQRLKHFFANELVIRADDGPPLPGRIARFAVRKRIIRDEVTGEPATLKEFRGQDDRVQDVDELVVVAELLYEMEGKPAKLTLQPPLIGEGAQSRANIGFVAYHNSLPVNDFRYLAAAAILNLDWDDPWYSRFRHPNLRRQYAAPLSAFLYVEPYEVRKEIIVRPKDLEAWIDLGLGDQAVIPVDRQEELKRRVAEFLADKNPLLVDGQEVEGRLDRIHFIHRTLRTTGIVDPPVDLDVTSATLGVIFVYPVAKLPQKVSMHWELFSPKIQEVQAVASDEAGGLPSITTPTNPNVEWQNYLKSPSVLGPVPIAIPSSSFVPIPLVTALCGGVLVSLLVTLVRASRAVRPENAAASPKNRSRLLLASVVVTVIGVVAFPYARVVVANPFGQSGTLESEEAIELLTGLLYNVYRAFDHHDESLIYDRLERGIAGDLLSQVYLDTRRSMELKNQGGLRITVKEVEVEELSPAGASDEARQTYDCRWRVAGSIGHWGHIHSRANEHSARLTIAPVDGAWKITALEMLDEQSLAAVNSEAAAQTLTSDEGAP